MVESKLDLVLCMLQFDLLPFCGTLSSLSFNFICRSNRIRTVTIYYSFQHQDFPYPIMLLSLSPRLLRPTYTSRAYPRVFAFFFFLDGLFSNCLALDRPYIAKMRGAQIHHFIGGGNFFLTKRAYLLNEGEKTSFRKIVILAKLLLRKMSFSMVNKMSGAQILHNINHFIGGHNLFPRKRTYLLNEGEKMPFCKIVILAKLLLCKMSSSTVYKMRGAQIL